MSLLAACAAPSSALTPANEPEIASAGVVALRPPPALDPAPSASANAESPSLVATSHTETIPEPSAASNPNRAPASNETTEPRSASAVLAPLPKDTLVLQIGDSFAAALGIELGKRLKAAGLRSALEYKTASYIPNWSFDGDVPKFVSKYRPDLVLITLGANEIEIPSPERRAAAIRHLVGEIGGRPCVWVAPPLWKPDTGLLNVIKANVEPCRYLDSNALIHDLPRGPDKIHPSLEGREIWANVVFQWLTTERAGSATRPWALKPTPAPQ